MYQTVFDVTDAGYRAWQMPVFGLVFMAIASGLLVYEYRFRVGVKRLRRKLAWLLASLATSWTLLVSFVTYSEYSRLSGALASGSASYVEGVVERFVPMPYSGHAMESFEVAGKRFEYSDYVVTAGFNHTASHGGPIRAGRTVKVWYVGDTIVRLQVAP